MVLLGGGLFGGGEFGGGPFGGGLPDGGGAGRLDTGQTVVETAITDVVMMVDMLRAGQLSTFAAHEVMVKVWVLKTVDVVSSTEVVLEDVACVVATEVVALVPGVLCTMVVDEEMTSEVVGLVVN